MYGGDATIQTKKFNKRYGKYHTNFRYGLKSTDKRRLAIGIAVVQCAHVPSFTIGIFNSTIN